MPTPNQYRFQIAYLKDLNKKVPNAHRIAQAYDRLLDLYSETFESIAYCSDIDPEILSGLIGHCDIDQEKLWFHLLRIKQNMVSYF